MRAVGAARHYIARIQGQPINTVTTTLCMYIDTEFILHIMLRINLKPLARFKSVWTALNGLGCKMVPNIYNNYIGKKKSI